MLCLLFVCSMLFAAAPGPKSASMTKPNSEIAKTSPNYVPDTEATTQSAPAPQYKLGTVEYRIQQIALNIEAVLPSKIINLEYKDAYLDTAGVPKETRDNFMSRNALYNDIIKIKIMDKAKENPNGLLEASSTASTEDSDKIKSENALRTELFVLIANNLNLKKEKEKGKVPIIYAEAIKYLKDYSLNTQAVPPKRNLWFITSITTIYKYDVVWDTLLKVLKDDNYILEKKAADKSKGLIDVKYKCGQEERSFALKICTLKDNNLRNCSKDVKDEDVSTRVPDGTIVWVQKGKNKDKSLIVSEESLGDQNIKLCKDDPRPFDVLEKLSGILIEADKPAKEKSEKKAKD